MRSRDWVVGRTSWCRLFTQSSFCTVVDLVQALSVVSECRLKTSNVQCAPLCDAPLSE